MKTERAPKGTPTSLNLFTLLDVFEGNVSVPNRLPATSVNGIKRCFAFGFVTATREALTLTALGANALCGYAMDAGFSPYGWQSTKCFTFDIEEK